MTRKTAGMLTALLAAGVLAFPSAAAAKGPVTLTVQAGYDGIFERGLAVPVTVIIESSRAVAGNLEVVAAQGDRERNLTRLPFEVPGGGRKRFDVLIAPPSARSEDILVRALDGDTLLARERVSLTTTDDVMVGIVAPDLPQALIATDLVPTMRRPKVFRLSTARISLGPRALRPLDYIVVAQSSDAISASAARAINGWVAAGGRLIVASDDAGQTRWLPASWRDAQGIALRDGALTLKSAGAGELVVFNGRPWATLRDNTELWQELIRPVVSRARVERVDGEPSIAFQLANLLTRPRGRTLKLDLFFVFLLGYLILVGPVNHIVLKRRGRRELAWITIPLISLLFSGIAYGFARNNKDLQRVHEASVNFVSGEAGTASHVVAVGAASRRDMSVGFGSRYVSSVSSGSFLGEAARTFISEVGSDGARIKVQTAPFSVAAVTGDAPPIKGNLTAQLRWDGHGFVGTVTNRTPYRLKEVMLSSGLDRAWVGDLAPGAATEVALASSSSSDGNAVARDMIRQPEMRFDEPVGRSSSGSASDLLRRMLHGEVEHVGRVMVSGIASGVPARAKLEGAPGGKPTTIALIAGSATVSVAPATKAVGPVAGSWWLAGSEMAGDWGQGCFSELCNQPGVLTLPGFRQATFGSRLPGGLDAARVRSGKVVISSNSGLLRGGQAQAPVGNKREVPVPVPVPQPVPREGGASGAVIMPPQAPDQVAAAYRFQYWDWGSRTWVEGEAWPGGKDSVPVTAISALGESYVRLIAGNVSGLDVISAGIEWELS